MKAWLIFGNQSSFVLINIPFPPICYFHSPHWEDDCVAVVVRAHGNRHRLFLKWLVSVDLLSHCEVSPWLELIVALGLSWSFWEPDHAVLKESPCLSKVWWGLGKAVLGTFQQKGIEKVRNKTFQLQTAQLKTSVQLSCWISPLEVKVEQCAVLLKITYLWQKANIIKAKSLTSI